VPARAAARRGGVWKAPYGGTPDRHKYPSAGYMSQDLAHVDGASRHALAREGAFVYLLVEATVASEPLPVAEARFGRRTVLTLPLFPPPQKN
jgi:hypothetical protein